MGLSLDEETNELSQISTEMNDLADQLLRIKGGASAEDGIEGKTDENLTQPVLAARRSVEEDLKSTFDSFR
ncbi:hypothetical protein ACEQPO_23930 [Bacillus sp. SL00103]